MIEVARACVRCLEARRDLARVYARLSCYGSIVDDGDSVLAVVVVYTDVAIYMIDESRVVPMHVVFAFAICNESSR
jgi:hypothetical protein